MVNYWSEGSLFLALRNVSKYYDTGVYKRPCLLLLELEGKARAGSENVMMEDISEYSCKFNCNRNHTAKLSP